MKTLNKITAIALIAGMSLFSCRKDQVEGIGNNGISSINSEGIGSVPVKAGAMDVLLTDDPGQFAKVNVEITRVDVHYVNTSTGTNGWISLATKARVYDLLEFENNLTTLLASGTKLPLGKVDQLRLVFGSNNSVVLPNDGMAKLVIPRGSAIISLGSQIENNMALEATIDFDAAASIHVMDDGTYVLEPAIKVKSMVQVAIGDLQPHHTTQPISPN